MPKLQQQQIKKIYNGNNHYNNRGYNFNTNKSGLGNYSFVDRHHNHKTYINNHTTDDFNTTHSTYRERMNRITTINEDDDTEENNYPSNIPGNQEESGDDDDDYEDETESDHNNGYGDDNNESDNAGDSYDDNEDDDEYDSDQQTCQMCYNQLDDTEKKFKLCNCGFKLCTFCLNETKVCPGCKTPFSSNILDQQQQQLLDSGSKKKKDQRKKGGRKDGTIQTLTTSYSGYYSPTQPQHYSSPQQFQNTNFSLSSPVMHPKPQMHQQYNHYNSFDKRKLENVRVVQHNLVYVTNIPLNFLSRNGTNYTINNISTPTTTPPPPSQQQQQQQQQQQLTPSTPQQQPLSNSVSGGNDTSVLSQNEYFGQYGKIIKLVVNYSVMYNSSTSHGPTVSCYVTYLRNEDASACINAVNGAWLGGKLLRASFGTTKYCTFFLKGIACTNPDCLYLHKLGSEQDSFTKETMAAGKNLFSDCVHPKISYNDKGVNIFPPPSLAQAFSSHATIAYEQAAQVIPPKYGDVIGSTRLWKNFTIVTSTTPLSKKVYTAFIPTDSGISISSDQKQRLNGHFSLENGMDKGALSMSSDSVGTLNRQLLKKSLFKQQYQDDGDSDDTYGKVNDDDDNNSNNNNNGSGSLKFLDGSLSSQSLDSSSIDGNRLKMSGTKERGEPGISDLISFETLIGSEHSKSDCISRNVDDNIEFCNGFLSLNYDCASLFNVLQKQNEINEELPCSSDFYQKMFSPKSFPQIYPHTSPSSQQKQQTIMDRRPSQPSMSLTSFSSLVPSSSSSLRQNTSNKFRNDNNIFGQNLLFASTAFSSGTSNYNGTLGESSHFSSTNYDKIQEQSTQQQKDPNDIASQLLFGCDFGVSSLCERIFGNK